MEDFARDAKVRANFLGLVETGDPGGEDTADAFAEMVIRGMDLFHVAVALEVAADGFLSFDDEQNALAEAAGLAQIRMRPPKR